MKRRSILLFVILLACSKTADKPGLGSGGKRQKLEYPVDVAKLETRQMQYSVNAPGSIDAFQQVQITARVAGAVDRVAFVEGQQVKAGDVLVTIEAERYTIALDQAKTGVDKAVANEKAAESALQRRLEAQKQSPGLVPGEEIEQKQTAVDAAKADLAAAKEQQRIALEDRREHRAGLEVLALLHGAGLDDARDRRAHRRVAQVEVRDR